MINKVLIERNPFYYVTSLYSTGGSCVGFGASRTHTGLVFLCDLGFVSLILTSEGWTEGGVKLRPKGRKTVKDSDFG